jgi:hypothetical protein
MPTGIRAVAALGRIVAAMRRVEQNWRGLRPNERVEQIARAVMGELTTVGVTNPNLQVARFPGLSGQFDFGPWTLQVDEGMAMGKVTESHIPKVAELGDTITHEARHCEQWFRMARYLAAERRAKGMLVTGLELGNRLGIRSAQATQAAAAAPALTREESQEAQEWYESVYGSQSSFRSQTYRTNLRSTGTGTGGDWQISQYTRYQRALAEEEDAWNTGTELQRLFLQHYVGVAPPTLMRHQPVRRGVSQY